MQCSEYKDLYFLSELFRSLVGGKFRFENALVNKIGFNMFENYLGKDYLDSNGQVFLNEITNVENKEWFVRCIRILRQRFPMADHWTRTSKNNGIFFLIGKRSQDSNFKRNVFVLRLRNGGIPYFKITNNLEKDIKSNTSENIVLDRPSPNSHTTDEEIKKWINDAYNLLPVSAQTSLVSNGNNPIVYKQIDDLEDEDEEAESNQPQNFSDRKEKFSTIPLNQILYGPPGTGKTFSTVDAALQILDSDLFQQHEKNSTLPEIRKLFKQRFDELVKSNKIRFTTFHQSYSYEDFVEGLVAVTTPANQIEYIVQPGVFQQLCIDASPQKKQKFLTVDDAVNQFLNSVSETPLTLVTPSENKKFVVTYNFPNATIFCAPESSQNKLPANIDSIKQVLLGNSKPKMYCESYVRGIAEFIKKKNPNLNFVNLEPEKNVNNEPYVLIIDEINRGNISKIFGELITLIEETKREGCKEALTVTLPYSKESFSIPSNVYIIGTMNTADRSLTGLDIALRRRFTFVEMPPKPELLKDVVVEGINIGKLLDVMNQRIEVLLDRDHCIGHAYFMPLRDDNSLTKLGDIFKRQIMPLLQEYFFDEYERIAWVLNDGASNSMPFIKKGGNMDLEKLFPKDVAGKLNDSRWSVNETINKNQKVSVFNTRDSYLNIIGDNN